MKSRGTSVDPDNNDRLNIDRKRAMDLVRDMAHKLSIAELEGPLGYLVWHNLTGAIAPYNDRDALIRGIDASGPRRG